MGVCPLVCVRKSLHVNRVLWMLSRLPFHLIMLIRETWEMKHCYLLLIWRFLLPDECSPGHLLRSTSHGFSRLPRNIRFRLVRYLLFHVCIVMVTGYWRHCTYPMHTWSVVSQTVQYISYLPLHVKILLPQLGARYLLLSVGNIKAVFSKALLLKVHANSSLP